MRGSPRHRKPLRSSYLRLKLSYSQSGLMSYDGARQAIPASYRLRPSHQPRRTTARRRCLAAPEIRAC